MNKLIEEIKNDKIVAIIRLQREAALLPVFEALYEGGLKTLEITVTTPGALSNLETIAKRYGSDVRLGVGSVVDIDTVYKSVDAGAAYIVTPALNEEVIKTAHKLNIPVLAGAMTPTEILRAYHLGCQLIKIFPAEFFGYTYIKAIKAPMPYVDMVPTGGVSLENMPQWFAAGASAVGVGSAFFKGFDAEKENYALLTTNAKQFITRVAHL